MASAGWAPIQGTAPCVALLASRGADDLVASKGFLSLSQLLAPFSTATVNVRDPATGMAVSSKINLDIRDIRKDGFLLSHTVLPHVLHEALQTPANGNWSVDGSLKQFNEALSQWTEPVDQETFRSYLSCLFFVSTLDENPLACLSQLIQLQHSQQHSVDGISLGPSHCAKPVWTSPTTLKHYVVVYEANDEQRSHEIFSSMCSTYGSESCSQLRLEGKGGGGGMGEESLHSPDPWASRLAGYRILEAGLERARLQLLQKTKDAASAAAATPTAGMGITTIASSYSISSDASGSPSTVLPPDGAPPAPMDPLSPSSPPLSPEGRAIGTESRRWSTQADKDACQRLVEEYARNNLVPHAERLMRTLNDAVAGRRGISRSLTSGMKKWFGGGSSSNLVGGGEGKGGGTASYTPESPQMQMRRLADIAFLFGLHAFAHSQYQAVKKEFAADNAWLYHALALEMSAYSLHLAHPQLTSQQFRCDYVENAIGGLLQNGARWPSLLRAGLSAWRIHSHLEMHTAAAGQLVRLTGMDNDAAVGVALWLASLSFGRARMRRKEAFYRFLAAHRWSKCGQVQLQLAAYAAAFPEYVGKRWSLAEERLAFEISSWSADGREAIGAAERLLEWREGRSREETEACLGHYGRVRVRHAGTKEDAAAARSCPLPVVEMASTRVIHGERPLSAEMAGWRGGDKEEEEKWRGMQRGAFHAIAGTSTAFRPAHIVSDADTDNTRVRETPAGERYRVQVRIRNPLSIPLQLRDVQLGVESVERREGANGINGTAGEDEMRPSRIESLHLQAEESRMVELYLQPSAAVASFRVGSVKYQLCCADGVVASGEARMEIRGRRLNRNEKEMKSVIFAADERLRATVATRAWPLCDVRVAKGIPAVVYADQLVTLQLEISNASDEIVDGLALAVDSVDRVMVEEEEGEGEEEGSSSASLRLPLSPLDLASLPGIRAYSMRGGRMERGARRRVVVQMRAPPSPTPSHAFSLLLLYRGVGGATREWRTRVETRIVRLLETSSRVLDPYHGLVALSMKNALTAHDAALARVECTRVRVAVAARHRAEPGVMREERGLVAVRAMREEEEEEGGGRVRLESGQSQEVCVRVSAPEGGGGGGEGRDQRSEWMLVEGEMPPEWPLPVGEEDPDQQEWGRRRMIVGVAWKANIVGNDGLVHSLVGESFLPDPFAAAGLHVAGLQLGFSLSSPGGIASPIPGSSDDEEGGVPPVYVAARPMQPIEWDFERRSLCEFPVVLVVRNECQRARMAEVEIRMKPKVRETNAPPPRQQWWLSKECIRVSVPPRQAEEVTVMVRVSQPSAYDVLGAQVACTARMEGDERCRPVAVPPLMAVVYAAYGGDQA